MNFDRRIPQVTVVFRGKHNTMNAEAQPLGQLELMLKSISASALDSIFIHVMQSSQGGHSAQVKMQLLVNGSSLAIAQLGPDFLLVDEPINHPPSEARVVLQIDQSERRWTIHLPNGISKDSERIAIEPPGPKARLL